MNQEPSQGEGSFLVALGCLQSDRLTTDDGTATTIGTENSVGFA
jgi:hypothetical protein